MQMTASYIKHTRLPNIKLSVGPRGEQAVPCTITNLTSQNREYQPRKAGVTLPSQLHMKSIITMIALLQHKLHGVLSFNSINVFPCLPQGRHPVIGSRLKAFLSAVVLINC